MNVFDQPDNFPPILFHAWEYLNVKGPSSLESMISDLAPTSFAQTAQDNVSGTIRLGIRIQLFTESSGLISNSDRIAKCDDYSSFHRVVRDIYFDQNVNPFDKVNENKGNLQLAAAWFFSFPYAKGPGNWTDAERLLPDDFADRKESWPILGPTQWEGFRRWMLFMGLAVGVVGKGPKTGTVNMLIRPSISEVLENVAASELSSRDIPLDHLLSALTIRMPSFPGGEVWNKLPESAKNRIPKNNSLLAETLRSLDSRGIINLKKTADSSHRQVFEVDTGDFIFDVVSKGRTL